MKRVLTLAVVSVLLLGGVYAVYQTTRGKVMAKKAGDAIDNWIGKEDVQRERINERVTKLEVSIDKLETEQFKTEEAAKTQKKYVAALEAKISNVELAMADVQKARTNVSEGKTVSVRGKDYTESDLKKIGSDLVEKHKAWLKDLPEQKEKLQKLDARALRFKERKDELAQEVVSIKKELKAMDEKMKEIEALKSASSSMGDADKTVGENMEALKKDITDLHSSLNIRLNKEDRHWDKVGKSGGDETDKFIEATKDASDPFTEIDAILKNKK